MIPGKQGIHEIFVILQVRPAGIGTGDDLHGIGKFGVFVHRCFPP